MEELGASGFVALFGLDPIEDAGAPGGAGRGRHAARRRAHLGRRSRSGHPDRHRPGIIPPRAPSGRLAGRHGGQADGARRDGRAAGGHGARHDRRQRRGGSLPGPGIRPHRRSAPRPGAARRSGSAGSSAGRPPAGRRTRFVGRDHELDLLRSRLAAAVRGQGQVVAIAGEAGIGKSRLIVELRQGLSAQPILCLEGHCLPYATPIPCLPLVELLRAACAIVETDGPEGVRDKLRATLDRAGMDALGGDAVPAPPPGPRRGRGGARAAQPRGGQGADLRGPARAEPAARGPGAARAGRGGPALDRPDLRGVPRDARRGRRRARGSCSSRPTGRDTGRRGWTSPTRPRSPSSRCRPRRA